MTCGQAHQGLRLLDGGLRGECALQAVYRATLTYSHELGHHVSKHTCTWTCSCRYTYALTDHAPGLVDGFLSAVVPAVAHRLRLRLELDLLSAAQVLVDKDLGRQLPQLALLLCMRHATSRAAYIHT